MKKNSAVVMVLTVSLVCLLAIIATILIKNKGLLPNFGKNADIPEVIPVVARGKYVDQQLESVAKDLTKPEYKMNQKEKYQVIHDFVATWLEYDYDAAREVEYHRYSELVSANDYEEAFETQKAVCGGYASLFYELCKYAGLDCRIVTGKGDVAGGSNIGHAWNIVKYDDKWYHMDVCWDDTSSGGNAIKYDWFLEGDGYATNYMRQTDNPPYEIEDTSVMLNRSKMTPYKFDVSFDYLVDKEK